jgi:transcription termination factor Rho
LKLSRDGSGVLRDAAQSFRPGPDDPVVPQRLVRQYALPEGATVTATVKRGKRRLEVDQVEQVSGLSPEAFRRRTPFADLVALDPAERIHLSVTGDPSMRIIDLIAPVGKGTRGLIVSPPKAGKTLLLEAMANSIRTANPEVRVIMLLIDERPEEVTHIRRSVDAEVLARTNDQSPQEQVELVELVLAMVRVELECGRDVALLVDSLTRIGRAFNIKGSGTRRTMSGGMEAGALEVPRRLFGLARNIEHGGSVTILATALVDTGSQMDQLIFQEFKGTGNSEVVLDRKLADLRIFPAINILESGTRKDERLYSPEEIAKIALIRRGLADRNFKDATEKMLELIKKHATNEALLESIPSV